MQGKVDSTFSAKISISMPTFKHQMELNFHTLSTVILVNGDTLNQIQNQTVLYLSHPRPMF